ncbi:MAG TPA: LON peptidase substrate-binding domain-containing protein [Thermoleophilia bacterium]
MTSADETLLGLFPLGLVLLPGEVVPLHIFEERYKLLIEERREQGEFGIVLSQDGELRECGCVARVADVVETLDDGRMNVLVRGGRRFRIVELREPDDPEAEYLSALVEYYDDALPDVPSRLRAAALDAFRELLLVMDVESPREPGGHGPLSFRIAAAVEFGMSLKQELLESLSEEQRLDTLLKVMEALLPRLQLRKEREKAIRGNGKGD